MVECFFLLASVLLVTSLLIILTLPELVYFVFKSVFKIQLKFAC